MSINKESHAIRLGLFTTGGAALLLLAIFILGKQKNLFDTVFKITTTFYDVGGLQVGNNVRFSGINVGTVDYIQIINDSTARVDMLIKASVKKYIKSDSEISIGSEGIIGDRLLIISQGSANSPAVKDGEFLASTEPVHTDEIIASLEVTALNIETISQEMAEIVTNINSGKGSLGRLIQDSTLADNLSKTMKNLESSSKGLDQNMEAAKESVLLRGFFKRKQRDAEKKKEAEKQKEDEKKKK